MTRVGEFPHTVKVEAFNRQGGKCAFCGVTLMPPRDGTPLKGRFFGEAHHLKPLLYGGLASVDNCVYLCYADHKLLGHGMAPFGIDNQGGSSRAWVQLNRRDFPFLDEIALACARPRDNSEAIGCQREIRPAQMLYVGREVTRITQSGLTAAAAVGGRLMVAVRRDATERPPRLSRSR